MLGIIGAMKIETDRLVSGLSDKKSVMAVGREFVLGKLGGKPVVVCQCGIGKVSSAVVATVMSLDFGVTTIINIGVAGGVGPTVRQGDIVIATKVAHHDYDLVAFGNKPGQVDGFGDVFFECCPDITDRMTANAAASKLPYHVGNIVSGDQFVSDTEYANMLSKSFGAIAVDMESAAIGHACKMLGIKFGIMRAISDEGDDTAVHDYDKFLTEAAERSYAMISSLLKE